MTDIAGILASYRSGQITESEMVDICREWPEVETALRESSITNPAPAAILRPGHNCSPSMNAADVQALSDWIAGEMIEAGGCAPPIVAGPVRKGDA
jgi:hypothetical protein